MTATFFLSVAMLSSPSHEPPRGGPHFVSDSLLLATAQHAIGVRGVEVVWPGFWTKPRRFVLARPAGVPVLITEISPGSAYRPLDSELLLHYPDLSGRAYTSVVPTQLETVFDVRFRVGSTTVTAIQIRDGIDASLEMLFHEAFHAFQVDRFPPTRRNEAVDRAFYLDFQYNILCEIERRLLSTALDTDDRSELAHLVQSALAVRERRSRRLSSVFRLTEREIEIVEGSAQYVGMMVRSLALGRDTGLVTLAISKRLREPLTNPGTAANERERLWRTHRSRLSFTGAAWITILRRLVPDVPALIESGAGIDQVASAAVQFDISKNDDYFNDARARTELAQVEQRVRQLLGDSASFRRGP
ncbi:MAG: hypothetical protein WEE89_20470 [Gemmatimonadota bacterium]